jgi:hypothetical protein
MNNLSGGCACGAVRYEAAGDAIATFVCHCADCQRACGGGPTYGMLVAAEGFRLVKGTPRVYWLSGDSGKRVGRSFCGDCGSPVFTELEVAPQLREIPVGSLDERGFFRPGLHMWVSSAPQWHHIDPALPRFEKHPPHP